MGPIPAWAAAVVNEELSRGWKSSGLRRYYSFPPSLGVEGGCQGHLANFIPRNANEGRGEGPQGRHTEYVLAVQNTAPHVTCLLQHCFK